MIEDEILISDKLRTYRYAFIVEACTNKDNTIIAEFDPLNKFGSSVGEICNVECTNKRAQIDLDMKLH